MTDRINALTVILQDDIREDDVAGIITAINMIRGVLAVEPNVADLNAAIAQQRAHHDLGMKVLAVVRDAVLDGRTPPPD